ncbi:hypothetical protein HMPREF3027_05170 [Porphyromonas sp. HMSC077F02]|uniref:glycosyltransferase family 4 protein n=1 Tax=Porphyromonas sp. HMSC077F02 TaxID=1739529 RepID=UPI0008A1FA7E|nr:glycosyltransferase family 1 protein [Porphyromonas sp. HMSC077F02]OFO53500.1 hypothetical protein HMPREF3027_05170 [Porphyromonas sp. HMSC077F02]
MNKQLIVISAVNINTGGTLEILNNCLEYLSTQVDHLRVIAIVHDKKLALYEGIEYIEIPWAKKTWMHRIWCEHITLKKLSKRLPSIDLWLSLHDTTPNVVANKRAVYCHNPFPFYKGSIRDLCLNYKIFFFAWLSKNFIYRPNIKKNDFVVVQTQWFKDAFEKLFGLSSERIIVFPPMMPIRNDEIRPANNSRTTTFFYPAAPNVHKNFELLCQASKLLEEQIGKGRFQTILTLRGDENSYAKYLYSRWGEVSSISFAGYQNQTQMRELYDKADALVFPSKVETWGLPITEFGRYGRPILLADLPYAHETAGGLLQTAYFSPHDTNELANLMKKVIEEAYGSFMPTPITSPTPPIANTWAKLFDELLQ